MYTAVQWTMYAVQKIVQRRSTVLIIYQVQFDVQSESLIIYYLSTCSAQGGKS